MKLNEKIRYKLRQKGYRKTPFKKVTDQIAKGIDDIADFLNEDGSKKRRGNK